MRRPESLLSRLALPILLAIAVASPVALAGDLLFTLRQDAGTDLYRFTAKSGTELVSPSLPDGRTVVDFVQDASGRHVVYRANQDDSLHRDLYHVDRKSGVVSKVHAVADASRIVIDMTFAPKGPRLVFVDHKTGATDGRLHAADVTKGPAVELVPPVPDAVFVSPVAWHPDGKRVFARVSAPGRQSLYLVDVAADAWTLVNGADTTVGEVRVLMDGRRIVYLQSVPGAPPTAATELVVVDTKSGVPQTVATTDVIGLLGRTDPDDRWLPYLGVSNGVEQVLHAVDAKTGRDITISGPVVAAWPAAIASVRVDRKGRRAVYSAVTAEGGATTVFAASLADGSFEPLLERAVRPEFTRSGRQVVAMELPPAASGSGWTLTEVDVSTGATRVLTPPLAEGGTVSQFAISPKGRHVAYVAEQEQLGKRELYRVDRKTLAVVKVSAESALEEFTVPAFAFDGKKAIVYQAGHDATFAQEVRRWTPKSGVAMLVHDPLAPGGSAGRFELFGE